jgi:hypothetical protein
MLELTQRISIDEKFNQAEACIINLLLESLIDFIGSHPICFLARTYAIAALKTKRLSCIGFSFFALQVFNEAPEAASHSLHTDNLQSVFSHILHPAIVFGRCNGDQCPECDKNKRARQLEARKHWIYFFALQVFNEAPEAASRQKLDLIHCTPIICNQSSHIFCILR